MVVVTLANILVLTAIPFMLWKKERHGIRPFFWPAFVLKITAGIALGLLYSRYYNIGDTFGYYNDGVQIAALANRNIIEYVGFLWSDTDHPVLDSLNLLAPRALFFTKFSSFIILVSGYNYWLACCYFSLLSFVSAWYLVREIVRYNPKFSGAAVFAFLFFPSVVFWTSGLIKESLAMACLYFITIIFLRLWCGQKVSISQWVILPAAMWILWGLKYYYLAILLPVIVTELTVKRIIQPRLKSAHRLVRPAIWIMVFVIPVSLATVVHPNFYPERFLDVIVSNHDAFVAISDPDDVIRFPSLRPDGISIALNTPKALLSGIFRPFIWEAGNVLQFLAGLENALLTILFGGWVTSWYRRRDIDPLLLQTMMYCLLLAVFLTLSTPNFGTLSRYRVGFLPFFVLLLTGRNYFVSLVDRFSLGRPGRLVP